MGSLKPVAETSESGFFASRVDAFVNWGRKNSLWPMPLGLSCCGIELMAMLGPKFDLARFGAEAARFSPQTVRPLDRRRHADLEDGPAPRGTIYDQMPEPKWVIAMGVCSSSGGMYDSYAVVQGVDSIMPVDLYVPGCPPRPDAVIDAILKLQKRIERESPTKRMLTGTKVIDEHGTGALSYQPNAAVTKSELDLHPHDPRAADSAKAKSKA